MKRIFTSLIIVLILAGITALIIFYGRGYRLDFTDKTVGTKGLLVANSQPNGASVFVNDKLFSATNTTLTLDPGWYKVRIEKEGYSPWQKELRVQGEVVAKTDAILFPINPSLSPLTVTGVINPLLSPDNSKIVFIISKTNNGSENSLEDDGGLFILDISDKPIGTTRTTRQIAKNTSLLSFDENTEYVWDPTSKKILVKKDSRYFLLDANSLNTTLNEATAILSAIDSEWENDRLTLERERLGTLKPELSEVLSENSRILSWSPDETKILYEATNSATIPQIITPPLIGTNPTTEERNIKKDQIYVYDIKEDKNYFIIEKAKVEPSPLPTPTVSKTKTVSSTSETTGMENAVFPLIWFPTSSHLLLTESGKISVMDYDATNKVTLYAGPFIGNLVAPWPNGSKIVILTTLNPQTSGKANLYTINIR